MDTIIKNIADCIKDIVSNTGNSFILKECNIISIKVDELNKRTYTTEELVDTIVDKIISQDIHNMKSVPGLDTKVLSKIDDLEAEILKIKDEYFK